MVKPNKYQLMRLQLALENREKTVSLLSILLSAWKFYLIFVVLIGGASFFLYQDHGYAEMALLIGIFIGVIWRDLTYARVSKRFKPISDYVTDWEKVKNVIDENQT